MIFGGKPKDNNQPKRRSLVVEAFNPHLGDSIRPVGQSFGMIVNLIAMIFVTQGLFPRNHPAFSNQPGAPKLRFADVFATAWTNLSFTKEGLPKVLMFFAVIGSIILSAFGVLTIVLTLLTGTAHAQTAPAQGFFTPANTTNDIGYNLIPFLFGTPAQQATAYTNLNTNAYQAFACGTTAATGCAMPNNNIQTALANGLALYSGAMLIFAAIILFYHLASMVVETAHTGVTMGRRANQIWAPIRLVAAVVLLVPISAGLNSGQMIVLKMAQWGSGLASNVWDVFKTNQALAGNGTPFSTPAVGSVEAVVKTIATMSACEYEDSYNLYKDFLGDTSLANPNNGVNPNPDFFINGWSNNWAPGQAWDFTTDPQLPNNMTSLTYPVPENLPFIETTPSTTIYHFRRKAGPASSQDFCGSISIAAPPNFADNNLKQTMAQALYTAQINTFNQYLPQIIHYGTNEQQYLQGPGNPAIQGDITPAMPGTTPIGILIDNYQKDLENAVYQATINTVAMNDQYVGAGWMGAGAFYNQVANIAITMQAMVDNYLPTVKPPAKDMADFRTNIENDIQKEDPTAVPKFVPQGQGCSTNNDTNDWQAQSLAAIKKADGSVFDIILGMLDVAASNLGVWCGDGTIGIRFTGANPLSSMTMWGQHNVDLAVDTINTASLLMISGALSQWGTGGKVAAGAVSLAAMGLQDDKNSDEEYKKNLKTAAWASAMGLTNFTGGLASVIGGFLLPFSVLFMTLGFMFGYMLPILPFMYFLFAGISWLAILLEAVIAVPLVALGHINPEGEGLPGQYARDAYFMAFSILLRPVLMIFGLIGGFIVMELAVTLLNIFFSKAMVSNTPNEHDTLMKLIYTIIYGVMIYSISNHAFQLINIIPNKIMGWIGARGVESVPMGQPETIINYSGIGVGALDKQVVGQLSGGINSFNQAGQARQAAAVAKQNQADMLKALSNKQQ